MYSKISATSTSVLKFFAHVEVFCYTSISKISAIVHKNGFVLAFCWASHCFGQRETSLFVRGAPLEVTRTSDQGSCRLGMASRLHLGGQRFFRRPGRTFAVREGRTRVRRGCGYVDCRLICQRPGSTFVEARRADAHLLGEPLMDPKEGGRFSGPWLRVARQPHARH